MLKNMNNINYVGIDLDDTLYDRDSIYRNTFNLMTSEIVPLDILFSEFNEVFQKESIIEYEKYSHGKKDKISYKLDRVITTYKSFGHEINKNQALIFHSLYEYFREKIELRPSAPEFIETLYNMGLKPFILTNGPSLDQWHKIHNLKLNEMIEKEYIFVSGDMGCSKPDNEVFKAVENKLNANSNEIIYIGDNLENDIYAAINNNWRAIYFNFKNNTTSNADFMSVNNFEELISLFKKSH